MSVVGHKEVDYVFLAYWDSRLTLYQVLVPIPLLAILPLPTMTRLRP
jgi:hypothetical protein